MGFRTQLQEGFSGAGSLRASGAGRLRVLLLGHQFQVPSEGQAKAAALSKFSELDIQCVAPSRYKEGECRWRFPVKPSSSGFGFGILPVQVPWCGPAKWYLQSYNGLCSLLERWRPHVIDVWEEPWNLLSAQIARLRDKVLPNSILISETEQNIAKNLPPPFEWLRRYTLKRADWLIARNAEAVSVVRAKGFIGPASVVGNGVDTNLFRPLNSEAANKGRQEKKHFTVGYCGRMVEEKGLLLLLEAIKRMPEPCSLLLSGDGPLLARLRKEPFVQWAGSLPREDLPGFYHSLDVLVLPSHTTRSWKEQFGRVLVEAQACGVPVIGSSSGAIPEVIGDAGLVFPEGNPDHLAGALQTLCLNLGTRTKLSKAGLQQVRLRYSWGAIAEQMRNVYVDAFLGAARSQGIRNSVQNLHAQSIFSGKCTLT